MPSVREHSAYHLLSLVLVTSQ